MNLLQQDTLQKAEEARQAAIRRVDKEQARYPIVETPEQEAEQRSALKAKGLSSEKIDKRIEKFKRRGGKVKTSSKLLKAGRILADTLAGYNPNGYYPGQPTAPLTQAREQRLYRAGEEAFNEALGVGQKKESILAQKAQFTLSQVVAKQQQEQAAEYEQWAKVAQGAQKYGIPVQDEQGQPVPKESLEQWVAEAESFEQQRKQVEQKEKLEMQREQQRLQKLDSTRQTAQAAITSGNASAFDYSGGHEDLMAIGLTPEGFQQMVMQGGQPSGASGQGGSQVQDAPPAESTPEKRPPSPSREHAKQRTTERTLAQASMDIEDAFQDLEDFQRGYLVKSDLLAPHQVLRNVRRRLIRGGVENAQIKQLLEGEDFAQAMAAYTQAIEQLQQR